MPIRYNALRCALHPLLQAVSLNELEPPEVAADEGHAPSRIASNVGARGVAVNAYGGVRRRGDVEAAQRGPEHRRGRQERSHHWSPRRAKIIVDQHGAPTGVAAGQEQVEPHTVGRRYPSDAVASPAQ